MRIQGGYIIDDKGKKLAEIYKRGRGVEVERLPACSIGKYFEILTWLAEKDIEIQ